MKMKMGFTRDPNIHRCIFVFTNAVEKVGYASQLASKATKWLLSSWARHFLGQGLGR